MNPGTYPAKVVRHNLSERADGTPYVEILLDVETPEGIEQITGYITFRLDSEKAVRFARKSLKAIGFDPDRRFTRELQDKPELLAGRECEVVIEEDQYRGDGSLRVLYFNAKRAPADPDRTAQIDRALRAAAAKPSKKQAPPSDSGLPPEDEEKFGF